MFNQILRPIAQRAIVRGTQKRLAHHESHFRYATLDDAPVPQGSWQENYNKKQKKYTLILISGVSILAATVASVLKFELIYFNTGPPKPKDA